MEQPSKYRLVNWYNHPKQKKKPKKNLIRAHQQTNNQYNK